MLDHSYHAFSRPEKLHLDIFIGIVIGFAIGSTGMGGGTLAAPALILVMGLSPRTGIATALVFSALVKIGVSGLYLWRRSVNLRILSFLLAGGLPGVLLGALLLQHIDVPALRGWIIGTVGLIVTISAVFGIFHAQPLMNVNWRPPISLPIIAHLIGLETGFSSAGAGVLGSMVLFNATGLPTIVVVGTDMVFGTVLSLVGGCIHALFGSCSWTILMRLVPAGLVGALIGTGVARTVSSKMLRAAVLAGAAGIGILLMANGFEEIRRAVLVVKTW